jgi:CNT family concentrative nucleoside transporter
MTTLITMLGMTTLMLVAFLASANRKAISLRTVGGAFGLQAGIGVLVLYFPAGKDVLVSVSNTVSSVISYGQAGISFLFGNLVAENIGFVFALNVLPIIVFFSSLVGVLYYIGVMGWVINILGGALSKLLGTSRTESLSATANVFVGQTEAPLVVKPFIAKMTESELFAVMVGGLATVAGSILAGYANLGVEMKYLIAASFMAAPGGFLMAKMMVPETQTPQKSIDDIYTDENEKPVNVIDAAASGAASGLQLALNVGAMLLAFVALIALLNGLLGWGGGLVGYPDLSIQLILGYMFSPVAWLLGVPWDEAVTAGSFIGQKLVLNEFVAYIEFTNYLKDGYLSEHTQLVVTFALCGFANLSSIAILLGGIGVMAPNRRKDIARLGLRAVMAGSMANLMSAAIAGFLLSIG